MHAVRAQCKDSPEIWVVLLLVCSETLQTAVHEKDPFSTPLGHFQEMQLRDANRWRADLEALQLENDRLQQDADRYWKLKAEFEALAVKQDRLIVLDADRYHKIKSEFDYLLGDRYAAPRYTQPPVEYERVEVCGGLHTAACLPAFSFAAGCIPDGSTLHGKLSGWGQPAVRSFLGQSLDPKEQEAGRQLELQQRWPEWCLDREMNSLLAVATV